MPAPTARALVECRQCRPATPQLTAREREVLSHLGRGRTNREIGWRLGIAEKTVKSHMRSIFWRLGVMDRTEAALWATRHGFLETGI